MEKWKMIKSETLVDSRWVKVRKDSVDLPNGQHIDDFYAISLNDAAAIVALDDAGNIVLKKEYRYCLDPVSYTHLTGRSACVGGCPCLRPDQDLQGVSGFYL